MKTTLKLALFSAILSLSLTNTGICQINWTGHIINDNSDYALSVYAIDVDIDGDMDVLEAAYNDGIKWWENDGNQNFTGHTIDALFGGANNVYAIDLDDDSDVDILGAAYDDDDITWWENNGSQAFTKHTIDGDFNGARSVYVSDLDSDGDSDVIAIARVASQIVWYENDGNQNFTKHIVESYFYYGREVHTSDVDSDGDIDVLGAAGRGAEIAWWENDGDQNFTKHSIEQGTGFAGGRSVLAIDIDNDGDVDVLGSAGHVNTIAWWENDGSQNFTKHIVSDSFVAVMTAYAIDMDCDGDVDIYGNAYFRTDEPGNKISWWENDGNQNFTEHTIVQAFDGSRDAFAIDLDSDGDIDVIGGASYALKVSWWESDLIANISGSVTESSNGLLNVPVDLFDFGSSLYNSTTSDASGFYQFTDVPSGDYTISIVTPLGYVADYEFQAVTLSGSDIAVDFNLTLIEISGEQRGAGFWKHQVNVYLSGRGNPEIPENEFSGYLGLIGTHFNDNPVNPIDLYAVNQPADHLDSLGAATALLSVHGNVPTVDRAKQQLMALLLNVASLKLSQASSISEDDATVSQAITYCCDLIIDGDDTNDEMAKDIAEQINNNITVAAGTIPLSTPNISYKGAITDDMLPSAFRLFQSFPNPFNAQTTIKYNLPEATDVRIEIYDLLGRKIETILDTDKQAGYHSITWNTKDQASGAYFYKIQAGEFTETMKMLLLK